MREFVAGEAALFRQIAGGRDDIVLPLPPRARERFGVGGFGERSQARLGLREQRGQRLGPHAVLARHVVNRRQPLLDALQFGGIEVEPALIVAQRARRFVELDGRRLEQRDDLRQRRVVSPAAARKPLRQLRRDA